MIGKIFKSLGDYFYSRNWEISADFCYNVARKCGAKMEW